MRDRDSGTNGKGLRDEMDIDDEDGSYGNNLRLIGREFPR